jgi:transcription elongation factor GreA
MNNDDKPRPIVTKDGLKRLKEKLNNFEEVKRPKIVERIKRARSYGDLSENSEYSDAREELELMDNNIQRLKGIINRAKVVSPSNGDKKVGLGSEVMVNVNGTEQTFKIVGDWEADPTNKRISYNSPIGKALMGKEVGEEIEVEAPAGQVTYKIVKIK